MFILNFLLVLLIIILLVVIFSTIIKFSMICIMRYNYGSNILFIPSIANIISCSLIFLIWYLIMTKSLNFNFADIIFNFIIKNDTSISNFIPLVLITVGFIIFGILIQACCYMLINISYKDSFGKIRMNIKGIFKKINNSDNENTEYENTISNYTTPAPKVSFINALIGSIFSFAFTFFIICILLFIGSVISSKII